MLRIIQHNVADVYVFRVVYTNCKWTTDVEQMDWKHMNLMTWGESDMIKSICVSYMCVCVFVFFGMRFISCLIKMRKVKLMETGVSQKAS